jgi:hypothetical protein
MWMLGIGRLAGHLSGAVCVTAILATGPVVHAGVNQWTSIGPEGGLVNSVAWHPTRNGVLFAGAGRVYRSVDSGEHWTQVTSAESSPMAFAFDPNNADRILASGNTVLRSTDGGVTFAPATQIPGVPSVSQLVVAADGSAVYATAGASVFRTTNFAQTWVELPNGLPGGTGDYATSLRISPTDPNTLYASFINAGLFKTTNGGTSWAHVAGLSGGVLQFAINPSNASTILASAGGSLWRSTDAGATWFIVVGGYFNSIEFDPKVLNRAVAFENSGRRLIVSTDSGGAWLAAATVPSAQANALALSPLVSGALALGTYEGVYYSGDGGQTLSFRSSGMTASDLRRISVSRAAPVRVYASFYPGPNGVYQHSAGSWQITNLAQLYMAFAPGSVIEALAADPNNSSILYASSFGGVAKTVDAGNSWTPPANYFGNNYVLSVAVDPANSQTIYAATSTSGIARSTDGGASWTPRNSGLPAVSGNIGTQFIAVDPSNSQRLYAVYQPGGALYRSTNAGLSWVQVGGGLPPSEYVNVVTFDPLDANRVYIGAGSATYRSLDGGASWSVMPVPINSNGISTILVDPEVPNSIVLLVPGSTIGVVRTVDYGATWERLPWNMSNEDLEIPDGGALDPAQPGNLIVGVRQRGARELQIAPDLAISLSGLTSPVAQGSNSALRVSVQNKVSSLYATADATVSLTLSATMTPGTIVTSRGSCVRTGQSVTCRLGAMKVGDTAQIDVSTALAPGIGIVTASVQPHEMDVATADNSATLQVTILPAADLRASITAPAAMDHGSTATLVAQLVNLGPHSAFNTQYTITMPPGVTVSSSFNTGGLCSVNSLTIACQIGNLPATGSASISIPVTGTTIGVQTVSASATANSLDLDPSNNAASAAITVKPLADLAIALSGLPASLNAGQSGNALSTVTNNGPDPVSVGTATLSGTNLNVLTATTSGGSCSIASGTASCSLGALAVGESRAINLSFSVAVAGNAQLNGSANSEATDGASGNNSATGAVSVGASASPPANNGGGGSGGGGALEIWEILTLILLLSIRRTVFSRGGHS